MKDDFNFDVKKKRPEEIYEEVSDYFKGEILSKYASSKNIMRIQEKITSRALEILDLKTKNALILDAGCGPGFSSIYLKELGFNVVALDLIPNFLFFYDLSDTNPVIADMCFTPFKSNLFDGILSISALQWIFRNVHNNLMQVNLINLIKGFYHILKPHSKCVFQFYPKNDLVMKKIGKIISENSRFIGNFIIDNPNNPRKRRIFLSLQKSY